MYLPIRIALVLTFAGALAIPVMAQTTSAQNTTPAGTHAEAIRDHLDEAEDLVDVRAVLDEFSAMRTHQHGNSRIGYVLAEVVKQGRREHDIPDVIQPNDQDPLDLGEIDVVSARPAAKNPEAGLGQPLLGNGGCHQAQHARGQGPHVPHDP